MVLANGEMMSGGRRRTPKITGQRGEKKAEEAQEASGEEEKANQKRPNKGPARNHNLVVRSIGADVSPATMPFLGCPY